MGTRHLIVVVLHGRWYIAQYGQYDGYPEVVGIQLVRLLASPELVKQVRAGLVHTYEPDDAALDRMWEASVDARAILDHRPDVGPDGHLRESQYSLWRHDPVARYAPELLDMLPSLARETSAAILVLVARGATAERPLPVKLEPTFANDGLFCEWAYVVDLDEAVLEVYVGASAKTPGHRFANVGAENASVPTYVASVPFDQLDVYKDDCDGFVEMINDKTEAIDRRRAAGREELDETDGLEEPEEPEELGEPETPEEPDEQKSVQGTRVQM